MNPYPHRGKLMNELKPCPFCGGVEIEIRSNGIGDYYAICDSDDPSDVACGAATSDRHCETPEGAISRWNGRDLPASPLPDQDRIDEREGVARSLRECVDRLWHLARTPEDNAIIKRAQVALLRTTHD